MKSSPPINNKPVFYRPDALPVAQPTVPKPPSASPLPWTVPTGAKTRLFDCVYRA